METKPRKGKVSLIYWTSTSSCHTLAKRSTIWVAEGNDSMIPQEERLPREGLSLVLFWTATLLFFLSWIHLLVSAHRDWFALSGQSALKLTLLTVGYPLPWAVLLGDWRRRRDKAVLLLGTLAYVVLFDAVMTLSP